MAIDLAQFHQVFFQESVENLDAMETHLMQLQPNSDDLEAINTIFRSAHSIKGGAATFGFTSITSFTHELETLLDLVRNGQRQIDANDIDLLLQSVDCLRDVFTALDEKQDPDTGESERLADLFRQMLSKEQVPVALPVVTSAQGDQTSETKTSVAGWQIKFSPNVDILQSGNEPLRLFREIEELGEFSVEADCNSLPDILSYNPKECHLSWTLTVKGDVAKEYIEEIFEWVADDSDISIVPLSAVASEQPKVICTPQQAVFTNASQRTTQASEAVDAVQVLSVQEHQESASANQASAAQKPVSVSTARAPTDRKTEKSPADTSIRVSILKIDQLINMVGELVITQSMLSQIGENFSLSQLEQMQRGLVELANHTRQLQDSVLQIRMLPINYAFSRFPRTVRDLSKRFGKKINLKIHGEQTELDKIVMEKIGDPMVHLIRNSIDHGIETPQERVSRGKPEHGTITLNAYHKGGNVVIEISDDGAGINKEKILEKAERSGLITSAQGMSDEQIHSLIFEPGFSTVEEVSDISGRGVGMDVVRSNISALNGHIDIESKEGEGSKFTIRLPLTLAILDGQLVRVGEQTYIVPLLSIVESLQVSSERVSSLAGGASVYRLRDEYIPIISLSDAFGVNTDFRDIDEAIMVVVDYENEKVGLLVDELLAQQQVVIKSLETNYKSIEGVSSATILGDGTVALILDIFGVVKLCQTRKERSDLQLARLLSLKLMAAESGTLGSLNG